MRKQIHMINRNGVYYFRRRIPKDLVSHYQKNEIIFSLKTNDHSVADRLQRQESVKLDEEFRRIRKGQLVPELHSISTDLIKSLTDLWTAHILEEDEEFRLEGLSEREYDRLAESLDITETGGESGLSPW